MSPMERVRMLMLSESDENKKFIRRLTNIDDAVSIRLYTNHAAA